MQEMFSTSVSIQSSQKPDEMGIIIPILQKASEVLRDEQGLETRLDTVSDIIACVHPGHYGVRGEGAEKRACAHNDICAVEFQPLFLCVWTEGKGSQCSMWFLCPPPCGKPQVENSKMAPFPGSRLV